MAKKMVDRLGRDIVDHVCRKMGGGMKDPLVEEVLRCLPEDKPVLDGLKVHGGGCGGTVGGTQNGEKGSPGRNTGAGDRGRGHSVDGEGERSTHPQP